MIFIPHDESLRKFSGAYRLSVVAFKRAKEIIEGAKPLVEAKGEKLTSIVLNEIVSGKVSEANEQETKE